MALTKRHFVTPILAISFLLVSFILPGKSIMTYMNVSTGNMNYVLFLLFGAVLLGIAISHERAFQFSIFGSLFILSFKEFTFPTFNLSEHLFGTIQLSEQLMNPHVRQGEWSIMINILGLLLGFAILASLFEDSKIPNLIPALLPTGWAGPFALLVIVFVASSFLDNIAAAMLGGTVAMVAFKNRLHIGYIAAIVAASNAGGAGSVLGDTTTTMMWINGVGYSEVLHAYFASGMALMFFGWFASRQQNKLQPFTTPMATIDAKIEVKPLLVVLMILVGAVAANVLFDMPAVGVWVAILVGAFFVEIPWKSAQSSTKGALFLVGLVFAASLMPVEDLPAASVKTAFLAGLTSAFFDNIPLTKICLEGGGYDWGILAYAVGFGGSMVWFGSSAGVALTSKFAEARSVFSWVKNGWHVTVAYVIGFFFLYFILGWNPTPIENAGDAHKVEQKIQKIESFKPHS